MDRARIEVRLNGGVDEPMLLDQALASKLLGLHADREMISARSHEIGHVCTTPGQVRFDQVLDDIQFHGRSLAEDCGKVATS